MSGLSAITRCPQTVAQDTGRLPNGMVRFDADDRFCLDGHRLMAVKGAYGADGTEYRTEIESYVQVISHVAPGVSGVAYFTARSKSGEIIEYGNTTSSRLLAVHQDGTMSTVVATWGIDSVQDRSGNTMAFSYVRDQPNGQFYPDQISYVGNSKASPPLAPTSLVQFVYETRPDPGLRYAAGYVMRTTLRLTKVVTKQGGVEVNEYDVGYAADTLGVSRVGSIALCDANSHCLPVKKFSSPDSAVGLNLSQSVVSGHPSGYTDNGTTGGIEGDFNGDGKTDILQFNGAATHLWISNGQVPAAFTETDASLPSSGLGTWRVFGTWDGDNRTEILTLVSGKFYAYKWNGNAWVTVTNWNGVAAPSGCCDTISIVPRTWPGDFDGNGITDVATVFNGALHTLLFDANGSYNDASQSNYVPPSYCWPGDFDGNGTTDLACQDGSQVQLVLSTGIGSFNVMPPSYAYSLDFNPAALFVADVNGDGRADIVGFLGAAQIGVYTSTGTQLLRQQIDGLSNVFQIGVADMNGDGKSDIVTVGSGSKVAVYYGSATGFKSPIAVNLPVSWDAGSGIFFGDFSGDGLGRIAVFNGTNLDMVGYTGTEGFPGAISSIDNGLGQHTSLHVKTLSRALGVNYTPVVSPPVPLTPVIGPMRIVTQVDHSNPGSKPSWSDYYSYDNGEAEAGRGRGFLGFEHVQHYDGGSGMTTLATYYMNFPFIGRELMTQTTGGGLKKTVEFGYAEACVLNGASVDCSQRWTNLTGSVYQVYPTSQRVTQSTDLDGSPLPLSGLDYAAPDAYGNCPVVTATSTLNGETYSKKIETQYANDPVNWLIGVPLKTVTTYTSSTLPATVSPNPPANGGSSSTSPATTAAIMSIIANLLLAD